MLSFAALGLPPALVDALSRKGITEPFPIQAATLPDALAGRDVLGRGATGSGKTLGFGLPMLTRLAGDMASPMQPHGLVLVPTRELAMQVHDALEPLAHALKLRLRLVVGGLPMHKQIDGLRRGAEIVIATPGRLTDLVNRRSCDLSRVRITVLDEADHMADMGFMPDVTALLDMTLSGSQRLLFSATLDKDVDTLVRTYLHEPVTHSLAPETASVSTMEHHLLLVRHEERNEVVAQIANRPGRTILFVRTKHGADRLCTQLRRVGVAAGALHGGKNQNARTRTLNDFRDGVTPVLVATDVAARGIHVDGIDLVLHVDPPADPKDYLHRAGRTARAGESGTVVTLVTSNSERTVRKMAEKAGVEAETTRVSPGHAHLIALTGARQPSGEPVPERVAQQRPKKQRAEKTWSDRPGAERPGTERPWAELPRAERPRRDRPRTERPFAQAFDAAERGERPARPTRPTHTRDSRPVSRDSKPLARDSKPSYGDRPPAPRTERPVGEGKRSFTNDRPARDAKPAYSREGKPAAKPSYSRESKPVAKPARTGSYADAKASTYERPAKPTRAERGPKPARATKPTWTGRPGSKASRAAKA